MHASICKAQTLRCRGTHNHHSVASLDIILIYEMNWNWTIFTSNRNREYAMYAIVHRKTSKLFHFFFFLPRYIQLVSCFRSRSLLRTLCVCFARSFFFTKGKCTLQIFATSVNNRHGILINSRILRAPQIQWRETLVTDYLAFANCRMSMGNCVETKKKYIDNYS